MNAVPQQVTDFLQQSGPFDMLDIEQVNDIARHSHIIYLAAENQDEMLSTHKDALYLIQSGQFSVKDCDGALKHLSEGDYFGYAALLDNVSYKLDVTVDSPGLVLCMPKEWFDKAMLHPKINQFFHAAKDDVLQHDAVTDSNSMWLHKPLFEVAETLPITISQTDTIQSAGALMSEKRISSVLIIENNQLIGIVTDRDLRNRVVAVGLDMQLSVKQIMTKTPAFLTKNKTLFDAVCLMNELSINHLPVLDEITNAPVGMITATDIFKQQRNNVLFVISDISKANNLYELTRCSWQLPHYFASSARRPGDFDIVGKVLSQATDVMTRKLITFFGQKNGQAPMPYCWLVFGSQAREDQTMGSDQDNALLLAEEPNEEQAAYFEKMAKYVCLGLGKCGIKLCDGNIMASNSKLRMSLNASIEQSKSWVRQPSPEAILSFNIFLDVRSVAGDSSLFLRLQEERQTLFQQSLFLAALARQANEGSVPLSMFQKFVYAKDKKVKDSIDLKHTAIAIINNLVRIHALANGITIPSTVGRLNALPENSGVSSQDIKNLRDIWLFLNRLRWRHQLNNKVQDNFIRVSDLSSIEKHQLKAAFQAIHRAQQTAVLKYSGGIG
ncbi:MAG: CBS domain-containing protein [Glaciecola sp.]|jgi:CBS domain-containing protein